MPTRAQKQRREESRARKAARVFDDQQLARLQQGAYRVYGCTCSWCQWREYNIIARRPDPGPGTGFGEAPPACKEPQTVKHRASVNATAPSLAFFSR